MRDVLLFASLIKEIDFILKLQGDTLIVPHSLFKNAVKIHEDSQGAIALTVAPKMLPCTKHIAIKYHHFQSLSQMATQRSNILTLRNRSRIFLQSR